MKSNSILVFFLTRSLFLGFGVSIVFNYAKKDSYIGVILGILLGLLITYLYTYVIKNKQDKSILELTKNHKIIGLIARVLLLIASYIILIYTLVIYKIFVTSFLLFNTPVIYVVVPLIILASFLAYKGLKPIIRVASSLFPLSLVLIVFCIASLVGYFELDNFFPILTTTPTSILKTAIAFAGITAFPNILTLHLNKDIKGYTKIYLLSALSLLIVFICVNGVLGQDLVSILRFPEYMVLKQLKLLNFIEKVENILSIVWAFDLFITITMSIYSIKELVPKKKDKLITNIILIITIFIISKFFAFDYVNELNLYHLTPYISSIASILVILPFIYLVKKNK